MMASSKNSTTSSCGSGCNTPSSSGSSVHSVTVFTDGKIPVPERRNHPIHEQTGTTDVLTFYPTMEEFSDFPAYIKKIETVGAHTKCGICKVIPPEGWTPRPNAKGDYSDVDEYVITNPVKEKTIGRSGVFVKSNSVYRRKLSVREFKKLATSKEYLNPQPHLMGSELEHYFFRNILLREPIYGADTEGSLYESQVKEFNMSELGTVLDEIKVDGKTIPGVNTVYLYFGMYKAMFPWHCEDMDLYSINYLHYGEPKYWFGISSESSDRFERLMTQQAPGHNVNCKAFLRHKSYICSPSILRTHNVPYGTMVQNPNEFIITFPKGYHMGWNLGYNCAESTNFASDRWIDFGKNAILCKCRPDCVEIDMSPFMKKYRPDEYEKWHSYWYQPKPAANALQLKKATKGKRGCSNGDDMLAPTSKKPRTSAGSAESSASLPGEGGRAARIRRGHSLPADSTTTSSTTTTVPPPLTEKRRRCAPKRLSPSQ